MKFKPTDGKPRLAFNFFTTCIHNHFKMIYRNEKYYRHKIKDNYGSYKKKCIEGDCYVPSRFNGLDVELIAAELRRKGRRLEKKVIIDENAH